METNCNRYEGSAVTLTSNARDAAVSSPACIGRACHLISTCERCLYVVNKSGLIADLNSAKSSGGRTRHALDSTGVPRQLLNLCVLPKSFSWWKRFNICPDETNRRAMQWHYSPVPKWHQGRCLPCSNLLSQSFQGEKFSPLQPPSPLPLRQPRPYHVFT